MYPADITRETLTEADVDAAVALQQSVMPNPWSAKSFTGSIKAGDGCYKLVKNNQLVAVGVVAQVLDEAELLTLAVAKTAQGHGLGRTFLADLMSILKAQSASQCMLEVMDTNVPAIATYSHTGFKQVATRKNYYRTSAGMFDALVMRLNY